MYSEVDGARSSEKKQHLNWRRESHYSLQPLPQADLDFIHFQDSNKFTNKFIGFDWMLLDPNRHLARLRVFLLMAAIIKYWVSIQSNRPKINYPS